MKLLLSYLILFEVIPLISIIVLAANFFMLRAIFHVRENTWKMFFSNHGKVKLLVLMILSELLIMLLSIPLCYWWFTYLNLTFTNMLLWIIILLHMVTFAFKFHKARTMVDEEFWKEETIDSEIIYK